MVHTFVTKGKFLCHSSCFLRNLQYNVLVSLGLNWLIINGFQWFSHWWTLIGSIFCLFDSMFDVTLHFWKFVKTSLIYDKFSWIYSFLPNAWSISRIRLSINWNLGNFDYHFSFSNPRILLSIHFHSYNSRNAWKNVGPLQYSRRNGWNSW